jgi:hypothetical protein
MAEGHTFEAAALVCRGSGNADRHAWGALRPRGSARSRCIEGSAIAEGHTFDAAAIVWAALRQRRSARCYDSKQDAKQYCRVACVNGDRLI